MPDSGIAYATVHGSRRDSALPKSTQAGGSCPLSFGEGLGVRPKKADFFMPVTTLLMAPASLQERTINNRDMKAILTGTLIIFTLSASAQNSITFQKEPSPESSWVKVYSEGLTGYLDETGKEIIPPVYEEIGRFGQYCTNMAMVRKDGLYGLVDTDGNVIVEAQYEMIGRQDEYKPGWILVKREGLYGFIDCSGEEIVTPAYTEIQMEGNTLKVN